MSQFVASITIRHVNEKQKIGHTSGLTLLIIDSIWRTNIEQTPEQLESIGI